MVGSTRSPRIVIYTQREGGREQKHRQTCMYTHTKLQDVQTRLERGEGGGGGGKDRRRAEGGMREGGREGQILCPCTNVLTHPERYLGQMRMV